MKSEEISRRSFLKRALALSAVSAIPSFWTPAHGRVLPTSPLISANDRVNIAFIGIGQRGGEIAKELYNTGLCNVVALCDVDMGALTRKRLSTCSRKRPVFKTSARCSTGWRTRSMP